MNVPPWAPFAGFAALAAVLIVGLRRVQERQARAYAQFAAAMGFEAIPRPDLLLAEQLITPCVPRWREARFFGLELTNVFHRSSRKGDLYLFDVLSQVRRSISAGRRDRDQILAGGLGIIRPGAHLPFFKIYRIPQGGGRASRLATRWLGWELGEKRVVRFEDVPEFDQRFTVIATGEEDEETVRQYLTPEARRSLLGFRSWRLMAGSDVLVIADPSVLIARGPERSRAFEAFTEEALRAAEILASPARARSDAPDVSSTPSPRFSS